MKDEFEADRFEAYKEWNRGVAENYKQNIKMLDNQILILSAGTLGLSLNFISSLVDLQAALLLPLLILSWVLLGTAVLAVLFGLRYATRMKTIEEALDAAKQTSGLGEYAEKGPDPKAGKARSNAKTKRMELYSKWSFWLFSCGLVAMVTFISINMLFER